MGYVHKTDWSYECAYDWLTIFIYLQLYTLQWKYTYMDAQYTHHILLLLTKY